MPRTIFPFDEINAFKAELPQYFANGHIKSEEALDEILDMLLDLFLLAYANGIAAVNEQFGADIHPTTQETQETIYKRIDGATWEDRVRTWYAEGGTEGDIVRIAETEAHRDGNTAAYETAVKAGAKSKVWKTMMDDRVRDTHYPLEGVSVPIDADFYTWDGDHAPAPGLFSLPENNINCRCELVFK